MKFPILPEGVKASIGLPLVWEPTERGRVRHDFLIKNTGKGVNASALRNYLNRIDKRYIITGDGVRAVEDDIGRMGVRSNVLLPPVVRGGIPQASIVRHFNQRMLGFQPDKSDGRLDGKPWEGSIEDFTGDVYDAQSIAELVGADASDLNKILGDRRAMSYGYVIVRAANYLASVSPYNADDVLVGNVSRLTKIGEAMVDASLSTAEQ